MRPERGPTGSGPTLPLPSPAVTIDVFADLACPWCSIGESFLQRALAARPHLGVAAR